MKTWMKASICIGLSFMFCFMSIGYAELSDTLNISGTAEIDIPEGLFIIDVDTQGEQNVDHHSEEYLPYTTTLDSTIDRKNSGAGTVTYAITVFNNTKLTYSYRGLYYQVGLSGYNGNGTYTEGRRPVKTYEYINGAGSKVLGVSTNFPSGKIVKPGEELIFYATYSIGSGMDANTDWRTLINFQFGINVDGEKEAIDIVVNKFLDILNTSSTYNQLVDVLDNKYDGTYWKSNYIGNVKGSTSDDSMAVNTLFAGQLQITVGSEQMDATVMIKHENIDGNEATGDDYTAYYGNQSYSGYGCEMTLYLTIDPLAKKDMGKYVPVYAIIFTCEKGPDGKPAGEWYRIGDTYYGEANVVDYDGGTDGDGGSFVTDNWRSRQQTYTMVEGYNYTVGRTVYRLDRYTYTIGNSNSIENVLDAVDANATNVLQTLLTHAKAIIDAKEYAGEGIELVEEVYKSISDFYTVDANGNPIVIAGNTRANLSPVISKLYYVVNEALIRMEALSKLQN